MRFNTDGSKGTALAIALLGGIGGCTAIAPEIEQAPAAEANTEAAVKGALIEALGVDGAAVGVAVADGQVTLDGFVADEAQRERALDAARAAADGLRVVDALRVRR